MIAMIGAGEDDASEAKLRDAWAAWPDTDAEQPVQDGVESPDQRHEG